MASSFYTLTLLMHAGKFSPQGVIPSLTKQLACYLVLQ